QGQWGVPEAVVDRERVEIVDRRKLHTAPGRVPEGPVLEVRVRVADDDHGDQAPDEIPIAGFTDDLEYRGCQPVIGGARVAVLQLRRYVCHLREVLDMDVSSTLRPRWRDT